MITAGALHLASSQAAASRQPVFCAPKGTGQKTPANDFSGLRIAQKN